ncbi:MAG: uracil-DNA glycosylase family protein [Bacteroidales bacterium]
MQRPNIEQHPLKAFIPQGAKALMLGTFPPKQTKWSIDFFYPNKINDMWRIFGNIFYNDSTYFIDKDLGIFDKEKIIQHLNQWGIAIYDTATEVIRLKDNASDKFLQIVTPINLSEILNNHPKISVIITTGEKAATTIAEITNSTKPKMGERSEILINDKIIEHYRMPSSSRAFPMSLANKSAIYAHIFSVIFKKNFYFCTK